jgi:GR25 family glycosyltransferase involved in LPS biosynthesis
MRNAHGEYIPAWSAARRPDILYGMPANDFTQRVRVGEDFYRIGSRYGTHSMIIRRSGMKKLLQFFKAHKLYLPYDMDMIYPYGIKLYTVAEDVVGNLPIAPSDNGVPGYLKQE